MKSKWILWFFLVCPMIFYAKINTGFYLSFGPSHNQFKNFHPDPLMPTMKESSYLLVGISRQFGLAAELNFYYCRSSGKFSLGKTIYSFDKDGIGFELGKPIHIKLFSRDSFFFYFDLTAGFYGTIYLYSHIQPDNSLFITHEFIDKKNPYQYGFYWRARLRSRIKNRWDIFIGFQALYPVRSNEFMSGVSQENLLYKSFIVAGISF